ncbi:LuxR C-terminal-related transcriptional regulator [Actinospongicola halichondriae]|uniref:LuxR C-terminal-related transcriptional regulator n=1 Tax=Actinospongicola halichondriae TaxID=3236844 RepID=UPI003D5AF30B
MAGDGLLLLTKVTAPRRRRGVVSRSRLDDLIRRDELPAVVLVSAPAGFGKTTLLVEWTAAVADAGLPTAWVSLEGRDSDPAVFWSYVTRAFRSVAPTVGAGVDVAPQSSPAALETVVGALVNDLASLDEHVVLVLDDYHVIDSLEVHESMQFLIEHLPERTHLVVASRVDPPWPLAGLRARRELLEVRASDLRFTSEEVTEYLNGLSGLDLTAADVDALGARTEGWAAALQLAALSLQGRDDPSDFVAQFAGDDRFVVDYLVDEVLDRQSEDVRSFLLETSILSRLTGSLCAAVTGRSDARAMLELVDRSNLFLVALDDRRGWFRYHHLFADVLRARLADEQPEREAQLHRRACEWLEASGDRTEAIRHAFAAEDFARAAELVERSVPSLRRFRQEATLRAWFDEIPDEIFVHRPVLALGRVGARMSTGDTDGVEAQLDDIRSWIDPGYIGGEVIVHDVDEFRRARAQVAMYRAGLALLRGDLSAVVLHGEHAAERCAVDDHLGRGAAAALVGLARWTEGDLEQAAAQYAAAIGEFEIAGHVSDVLGCRLGLSDIQVGHGRLADAEQTLRAGLEIAVVHGPLRGVADMHVGLAEIHLERNELASAADHLRQSMEVGERFALGQHPHRWRVVDARLCSVRGDHEAALDLLTEAERRYDPDYSPKVRPVGATRARARLLAGDVAAAQRWAVSAGIAADDELTYLREYEHLTLARVLLAGGDIAGAISLAERLRVAAESGGRTSAEVEAGSLLALAHEAGGDTAKAVATIEKALVRAEAERLVRVFLDAGETMTALLRTAVRHGRAVDQCNAILGLTDVPPSPRVPELVDPLSNRELDVLRLLRSELTGPEIATELIVSLNTVRTHTKNIFCKLGVSNRRAAVRRADELGL